MKTGDSNLESTPSFVVEGVLRGGNGRLFAAAGSVIMIGKQPEVKTKVELIPRGNSPS